MNPFVVESSTEMEKKLFLDTLFSNHLAPTDRKKNLQTFSTGARVVKIGETISPIGERDYSYMNGIYEVAEVKPGQVLVINLAMIYHQNVSKGIGSKYTITGGFLENWVNLNDLIEPYQTNSKALLMCI